MARSFLYPSTGRKPWTRTCSPCAGHTRMVRTVSGNGTLSPGQWWPPIATTTLVKGEHGMTGQDYLAEVLRTYAGEDTQKDKLTLGALGLAGEGGEVIDLIKKWSYAGHDLDTNDLLSELGDVLWYMALMCSAFGWTLE